MLRKHRTANLEELVAERRDSPAAEPSRTGEEETMKLRIRGRILVTCLGLGLAAAPAAQAAICTVDEVPAATLLLPYFEVDLENFWGPTTLFEINNASATAIIAHVVVWTDLSVPVLDFNVYLTGYDIVPINMRDILDLTLPQTAPPSVAPGVSNVGAFSVGNPVLVEASCQGQLPPPPLDPFFSDGIKAALTGQPAQFPLGGLCGAQNFGDNIARGYVTVDAVRSCSLEFPGDPGYFVSGGQGTALNDNILWGHVYRVFDLEELASGWPLVHVEADGTDPETSTPGEYTFYGRYVGWTAEDNREPLGTSFAARFLNQATFSGGSHLTVWRDAKVVQGAFACGSAPTWFPLGQEGLLLFDEEENVDVPPIPPISPAPPTAINIPFPAEAQRVRVGGSTLAVEFDAGWAFVDLNTTVVAAGPNPPEDPFAAQGWVGVEHEAEGRFSVGYAAVALDSACLSFHLVPGPPGP
jgi:hypothetical protein